MERLVAKKEIINSVMRKFAENTLFFCFFLNIDSLKKMAFPPSSVPL